MCLKIQPSWSMPVETERIGRKILKADDPYRLMEDRLFESMREEEFANLYSVEWKPGLSPIILALVSVFQFMEKLADRQAANALRIQLTTSCPHEDYSEVLDDHANDEGSQHRRRNTIHDSTFAAH